jgi:putative two-component system response regulator
MDGFETLAQLRKTSRLRRVPVIFLTARQDQAAEIQALQSGAKDFIVKPFVKEILLHRIELHLRFAHYQRYLKDTVKDLEDSLAYSFAELIECRDVSTGGHVQRTRRYVSIIGEALRGKGLFTSELDSGELNLIVRAASLHDIGKIGVSDLVLLKPGRLDVNEFAIMQNHTLIGADILEGMLKRSPTRYYLAYAKQIAESHHERYDGKGYPHGLGGEAIPLCARMMVVADVYDALVADRVYRPAMSHKDACRIILEGRGLMFDPRIVDVFEAHHTRFAALRAGSAPAHSVGKSLP